MKQLILMIVLTSGGALGAVLHGPFWGLIVYYLFAVLRPQYLWKWTLPDVPWSFIVALATLGATALHVLGFYPEGETVERQRRMSVGHVALIGFVVWLTLSYLFSAFPAEAHDVMIEYSKIFLMMGVSAILVRQLWQVQLLVYAATLSLCYVAYEVNFMYLVQGYLGIFHNGYGGLDNNGAGLMLAMSIPLCFFLWESTPRFWRWGFAAMIPVVMHAVLMTYSRGAMVALVVAAPLIYLRSQRKWMMTLAFVGMAAVVPILAGPEIQRRFFSVQQFEEDRSAQSRFTSWRAGLQVASDYPILGIGPRNSPLVLREYGADIERRAIHSQYVQIAADNGFVGLAWYLALLGFGWLGLRRVRQTTRGLKTPEARTAHGLACAIECSMAVFCAGALFLSLEVFELPYMLIMLSLQLPLVVESLSFEPVRAPAPTPAAVPGIRPEPALPPVPARVAVQRRPRSAGGGRFF